MTRRDFESFPVGKDGAAPAEEAAVIMIEGRNPQELHESVKQLKKRRKELATQYKNLERSKDSWEEDLAVLEKLLTPLEELDNQVPVLPKQTRKATDKLSKPGHFTKASNQTREEFDAEELYEKAHFDAELLPEQIKSLRKKIKIRITELRELIEKKNQDAEQEKQSLLDLVGEYVPNMLRWQQEVPELQKTFEVYEEDAMSDSGFKTIREVYDALWVVERGVASFRVRAREAVQKLLKVDPDNAEYLAVLEFDGGFDSLFGKVKSTYENADLRRARAASEKRKNQADDPFGSGAQEGGFDLDFGEARDPRLNTYEGRSSEEQKLLDKAYKAWSKKWHPDLHRNDRAVTERFQIFSEAKGDNLRVFAKMLVEGGVDVPHFLNDF